MHFSTWSTWPECKDISPMRDPISGRKDRRLTASAQGNKSNKQLRANRPPDGEPWIWFTQEMLNSPAMKSLTAAARLTLDRLMIEHMAHAGSENGNLICTHKDIAAHGVRHSSIADAIRLLEYTGLIRVQKGRFFKGEHTPNKYRLTWLASFEGMSAHPATNEWKAITEKHVQAYNQEKRRLAKMARERRERNKAVEVVGDNVVSLKVSAQ